MALIRISPDGKEVVCLHDDFVHNIIRKHSDVEIKRATDVYYNNDEKMWRVKLLGEPWDEILPVKFFTRKEALDYERIYLEYLIKDHEFGNERSNTSGAK